MNATNTNSPADNSAEEFVFAWRSRMIQFYNVIVVLLVFSLLCAWSLQVLSAAGRMNSGWAQLFSWCSILAGVTSSIFYATLRAPDIRDQATQLIRLTEGVSAWRYLSWADVVPNAILHALAALMSGIALVGVLSLPDQLRAYPKTPAAE